MSIYIIYNVIAKFTKTCRNILRSGNILFQLRDNIISGVVVKLKELSSIRNKSYSALKEAILSNELHKVCEEIKMETELLSSSISKRDKRKHKRDI